MSVPDLLGSAQTRPVSTSHDAAAVARVLAADPLGACMVAARVFDNGLDSAGLGGELWTRHSPERALCFAGASLIPLRGAHPDLTAFADHALGGVRRCSSVVGHADLVLPLWQRLERGWGPARDVRPSQPLLALRSWPRCAVDLRVRRVRVDQLDAYLVAAVDMFIGEVGVDPRAGDGGRSYRRRVASLIASGRAFARFENGRVVFKAEVAAQSPAVGQIQGVWVDPQWRGRGLGSAGTAAVAAAVVGSGRIASLYVNGYNSVARAAYTRVGFRQEGTFATVLLD